MIKIPTSLFIIFFVQLLAIEVTAQISVTTNNNKGFTTNNPFNTDVFVENLGQFNAWVTTSKPIKYVVNNNDKIFFTQQGLTFKLEKWEKITDKEEHKNEEEEHNRKTEIYYIHLHWEGSNPNANIITSQETNNYYTFGEQGYENIKAKGYKKITYKNIYPNIDVEYTIPEKGGIKYQIKLHTGADASLVKMHYTGAVKKINISPNGDATIETPAGTITDHAPKTFYESTQQVIASAFQVKKQHHFICIG